MVGLITIELTEDVDIQKADKMIKTMLNSLSREQIHYVSNCTYQETVMSVEIPRDGDDFNLEDFGV